MDTIAPVTPKWNLAVRSHERKRWIESEHTARYVMIMFLLCACKYIWQVNETTKEYITGMHQMAIFPASSAIASFCPRALKRGVANT